MQDNGNPPLNLSGAKKILESDENQELNLDNALSILKKKVSSKPTSEETAWVSPTKQQPPTTSLATEVPTRAQVSVSLGGPTKLFPPKEEQHPTSIMWGNEPKKEGFIPPSTPIDIDQSIKYLEKTKSNPKELKRLKEVKAKMPETPPVEYFLKKQIINNLTPAVEEANTITDEDKLQRDSEFEKDWNKTGFLNKAKQIGATILGETGNLLTEFLSFGKIKEPVTKEAMQIEPLEKYKNEVIKEATESKIKLSPEQFKLKVQEKFNNDWDTDKKAYNLSQLNYTLNDEEQKAIGEDTFNKYKDLNENQKYFLNTSSTLSKVRDNIGLELVNLDKQLSEKIKNGETPTESEIQSYNALSEKYKQYHSDAQNAYSKYAKNLDKVHSLETELDVFDNENLHSLEFLKRLGIGVEQLGVGAIDFASYLANLHANTTPYSVATNSGNSELAIYLHKKANDLRDTIEQQSKGLRDTSNRFESVLSKSVDFVTENTPMVLGLTFGGAPAMFALAGTTAGEKYGEMLNENKDYNEFQKTIAPLLHGGAMLIPLSKQLKTIQNSGRVLLAGEKEFPSIVENVYKEKAANLFGKIKTFTGESFDLANQLKLMEVLQEVNNGVVLGKDIDYKKLADLGVYETAPLLHGMNKVAPYLAGRVTEPFMSKEDYKIIDGNTKQIFDLNKKLLSGELDANEADIVRQTIKDISAKSEEVVNNKLNRIGEYDKQTVNDILETTKKSSELREKANRVISSDKIDSNQKEVIIKNLRGEYSSIEQTKTDLISGRTKNIVYVEKESDIPAEENRPKGVQYKVVENSVEKKLFEQQQAKPTEVKVEEQAKPDEVMPTEEVMSVKGISPETSSNVANLTEDAQGNYVFFHVSPTTLESVEPSKYGTNVKNVTSAEEKAAVGRVGGVSMYYTSEVDQEHMVKGNVHAVKIPKEQVYDFNSDPLNLAEEAKKRFKEEHPNLPFTANDQFAQITKLANEKGFKMVVGEWKGTTRAQTTESLKPVDVKEMTGDVVSKPFAEEYISNKDKGYKSIIPETKESKFAKVYDEINSYKNNLNKYDDLYHLKNNYFKYSQEEITKMIKESDLPQELKDKYNEALNYVEEKRRTEIPVFERTNDVVIKNAPEGNFLNIGLNIGTTDELLNKDDVVSMLPKGVKILDEEVREVVSEIDGKKNKEVTLLVKLSRQLTDAEMSKLLKDTQQKAIPQLTEGKGAMHGTKEWGDFNPEYFYLPKEGQLSEYKKPITAGKEVEYNGRKYFKNEAGNWVNAETNNEIKGIGEKGKALITELDKLAAPKETYTEKTKKIADKIRASELPDWMKANIEGGKKQGVDADSLKEALAKAVEKTGELLDKGVELADAIKEAVNDIVGLLGEEKRTSVEKDFENYYKSIEEPVVEEPKKEGVVKRVAKSFFENDIAPMFKSKAEAVAETVRAIVNTIAPKVGVKKEVVTKFYKLIGDRNKYETLISKQIGEYKDIFNKMTDSERLAFIDRYKLGEKQPTPELQTIAKVLAKLDAELYNEITKYNPNLAWKENHYRVLWKKIPGTEREKFWSILSKRPLRGSKGFFGQSTLSTISEGIAKGGVPYSTNPIEMFEMAYSDGMRYITAQRIIESFKKDGIIKFAKSYNDVPEGYVKINDSVANVYFKTEKGMVKAGEYYIEENAGRMLNNMLSRDYIRDTKLGKSLMDIKNFYTSIELGLSPFHAVAISLEQIASAQGIGIRKIVNLGDVKGGIKDILTSPFSPKTTFSLGRNYFKFATVKDFENSEIGKKFLEKNPNAQQYINDFFDGGGLVKQHEELKHNAYKALKESMGKDNYIGATLRALPAFNEGIMSPLFNVYIPSLKIGLFMKEFPLILAENKSKLESGKVTREELSREVVNDIDNRLGEMNFDNLYWNRTFKTSMQFMLRSVTWRLGNLRQMGGAFPEQAIEFVNAVKENRRPNLEPKMAWLFGLSLTQVVLASVIQGMSLDDDDKDKDKNAFERFLKRGAPKDFKDIVAPRINSDDSKERVVIPTYYKDLLHFWHAPSEYITSGASGPASKLKDIYSNKDFYNYEIYDETDPKYKQLIDAGKYFIPKPFSITSAQKMKEKGEPIGKQVFSFMGFNKAPGYLEHSDLESEIIDLYRIRNTSVKPLKAKEANDKKKEIRDMYKKDIGKAQELANQAVKDGLLRPTQIHRLFKDVAKGDDAVVYFFQRLPDSDKEYLAEKMTEEEKVKFHFKHKLTDKEIQEKYPELYQRMMKLKERMKKKGD